MPDLTVALTLYGQSPSGKGTPPINQDIPLPPVDSHSQYRHHPPPLPPPPPPPQPIDSHHYLDDDNSYPGTPYEYNQPPPHHHHHHHHPAQPQSDYQYYPPSPPSPPPERYEYRERRPEYRDREYSNYGSSNFYGVEQDRERIRDRDPYERLERRDSERELRFREREYRERENSELRGPPGAFTSASSGTEDTMDPLLELRELKFTPRTTAGKHLARFERLVSLAYPEVSDGGKWTLFSKTLDYPAAWGSGKGVTPGKWLASLSEKTERNTMSFEQLKSVFIERWGTRIEREQLRANQERERERERRDRERDEFLHQQLMHTADLLPPPPAQPPAQPPLAPEPPPNNRSAAELVIHHDRDPPKTKLDIQKNMGSGQIVLTITDQKPKSRRRDRERDRERDRSRAPSFLPPEGIEPPRSPTPQPPQIEAPPSSGMDKPRRRETAVPGGPLPSDDDDDGPQPILAIEAPPLPLADAIRVEEASPPAPEPETSTALVPIAPKPEETPAPPPIQTRPRLLEGKIAAVTGASRGIGRAIALGFAKEGAHVVAHYWGTVSDPANDDILSLANEIKSMGQKCDIVFGDISDPQTSENIVRKAVEVFGRLDIAVGNAGMCWYRDFWDVTPELLRRHVDVNLNGNFFFVQAVARQMKMQYTQATKSVLDEDSSDFMYGPRIGTAYDATIPDHSILLVSSNSALAAGPGTGLPNMSSHYSPTQAGLLSLMQSSAVGLGRFGIRVNALLPGTIMTRMVKEDLEDGERRGRMEKRVPLGRLGRPRDLVGPAVFLGSEQSRYVSGAQLLVDGGAFANLGG